MRPLRSVPHSLAATAVAPESCRCIPPAFHSRAAVTRSKRKRRIGESLASVAGTSAAASDPPHPVALSRPPLLCTSCGGDSPGYLWWLLGAFWLRAAG